MQQYQHIVRATFTGHTSEEGVALTQAFYAQNPVNIGLNFVTGSLSPYTGGNPSFAVIEFDADHYIPVSYKTYGIDMSQTNTQNQAQWSLIHDYATEYNLVDLSPDSIQVGLAN